MSDEFGVDLDKIVEVIDVAEVLVVRFHIIEKRLLVDFRTKPGIRPLIQLVPKAESVEDRFRSIKRLRPEFGFPEKVMSFPWPRSIGVLEASGVWSHLETRLKAAGDDDTARDVRRTLDQLRLEERKEVTGAILGAQHYQTLWQRTRK